MCTKSKEVEQILIKLHDNPMRCMFCHKPFIEGGYELSRDMYGCNDCVKPIVEQLTQELESHKDD